MATVGFNVTDEQKMRIDAAAEAFAESGGGTKADFLRAAVAALEAEAARTAAPGRADEIERFETMLGELRAVYLSSISAARAARTEAEARGRAELEAARNEAAQARAELEALKQQAADVAAQAQAAQQAADALQTELETARAAAQAADARAAEAEAGKNDLATLFQRQISAAVARADAMAEAVAEAEALKQRAADAEAEAERLKSALETATTQAATAAAELANEREAAARRQAEADARARAELDSLKQQAAERLEIALARAANEREAAVLAVKREAVAEAEAWREKYAQQLQQLHAAPVVDAGGFCINPVNPDENELERATGQQRLFDSTKS